MENWFLHSYGKTKFENYKILEEAVILDFKTYEVIAILKRIETPWEQTNRLVEQIPERDQNIFEKLIMYDKDNISNY